MEYDKVEYIKKVINKTTSLDETLNDFNELVDIYFSRGYDTDGANPIIADDFANVQGLEHMTPQKVADFITLAQNIKKFMENDSPALTMYNTTVSKIRKVPV